MANIQEVISKAGRRIRALRGLRGFGFGLFVGSLLALAWVVLDLAGVWLTEWAWMGAVVLTCAVVGLIVGWALPLHQAQVARSLDRRAGLKDRATAALESEAADAEVAAAIQHEAESHLNGLDVRRAYPVRTGPWPGMAAGCLAMAAVGFWLVNSGVLLDEEAQKGKEKLEQVAAQVERIAKPLTEKTDEVDPGDEERELARQMVDMAKKLERGRLNEEEAMRKAEQLVDDGRKLAEKRFGEAQKQMASWQQQMTKQEFQKAGIDEGKLQDLNLTPEQMAMVQEMQQQAGIDPSGMNEEGRFDPQMMENMGLSEGVQELMKMTPEEREAMRQMIESEMKSLADQMGKEGLSKEEQEALNERMKQLQELMKDFQLSEEVYEAMRQLMESETYRELQEMMAEMMKMQEQAASGEKMSEEDLAAMKEQIKEMQERLEEWAEQMQDPEFRAQVEAQMKEMLEALKRGELTLGQCQACMGLFGMNGLMQMPGGPGGGGMMLGEGENRKQEREGELAGDTTPLSVRGQRQDKGEESYVEIKAPTTVGNRSSVPYDQVLPKYKQSAESAMSDKKIPKKHEKRVKEYFDSLTGGKAKAGSGK